MTFKKGNIFWKDRKNIVGFQKGHIPYNKGNFHSNIDKNKNNNDINNLATFCRRCHTKIHFGNYILDNIIQKDVNFYGI